MHHPWRRLIPVLACCCLLPALVAGPGRAAPPISRQAAALMGKARPRLERELAGRGLHLGAPIFIRIFKIPATLEVWMHKGAAFTLFKKYPICSYSGFPGPKLHEGDWQSPEGFYSVPASRMNPNSSYHLAFNIGYPNEFDQQWSRTGSSIMVHGECSSRGCFAMGNPGMEEIYLLAHSALAAGQQQFSVHVFPFPLTDANLAKYRSSPWIDFWQSLQPGYLAFERTRTVPVITVQNGAYVVREAATRLALVRTGKKGGDDGGD
ncbi:MAG TPA: murein L,D-transpeptidase [Desulfobulbus sp.]|nr:murein L,D-transpeptidase [Desulfobulbus sp.]